MNMPLVTIAIPIYNTERFLRDAIQSVINQTYQDWILYLINDGSTDGSTLIMEEYAKRDLRIRIIDDGQNKGLAYRLNQSISLTKTKYYARMDADDIMYKNRIEEQIKYLESHPEVDVLGTSIMTIDGENNIVGSGLYHGKVNSFVHPTIMGKSEWFKTHLYREWAIRTEDTELWFRTSHVSNFYSLDKPLLFYREFGIPTLRKYFKSQVYLLRIFYHFKDYNKSFVWFLQKSIFVIIKICIYIFFSAIGKTDFLIRQRRRNNIPQPNLLNRNDLLESIS